MYCLGGGISETYIILRRRRHRQLRLLNAMCVDCTLLRKSPSGVVLCFFAQLHRYFLGEKYISIGTVHEIHYLHTYIHTYIASISGSI